MAEPGTVSLWQRSLSPASCDVAVVGGGVVGCATAYWLHRLDPALQVVVLEAETLAFGASGRNAGFLLLGTHTDYASAVAAHGRAQARQLWRFTEENAHLVRALDGPAFDLRLTGSLLAAGSPGEADRLRQSAALLAEDGIEAQYLGADAANARMGAEGFLGALVVPEGGALHPARLVRYLARESGASVVEGARVTRLEKAAGAVRLTSEAGTLEAERVMLALGAYLPRLVPEAAAYVRPVRAQMLATVPTPPLLDAPVYSHDGFYYLRQTDEGRLLLGGARHLHEAEEVGYEDATTAALQADLEAYLHRHFPAAEEPEVVRRWSGTMGFSPDGLPVVGDVPGVSGALFATGFTGHGMGYSLRFGQLLARRLLGQPDEAARLFDSRRFAKP